MRRIQWPATVLDGPWTGGPWTGPIRVMLCCGVAILALGCESETTPITHQNDAAKGNIRPEVATEVSAEDNKRPEVSTKVATSADPSPSLGPYERIAPRKVNHEVPKVLLSKAHAKLCTVKTDDTMPPIELPDTEGKVRELSSLYGKKLTVVCFWKSDRAFARSELTDLGPDVSDKFSADGVNVVGIAVQETPESAVRHTKEAGIKFPMLVDSDGSAFSLVGTDKLPRTYLLDAEGKILWFDIEYSRSTRRELHMAIQAALNKS